MWGWGELFPLLFIWDSVVILWDSVYLGFRRYISRIPPLSIWDSDVIFWDSVAILGFCRLGFRRIGFCHLGFVFWDFVGMKCAVWELVWELVKLAVRFNYP